MGPILGTRNAREESKVGGCDGQDGAAGMLLEPLIGGGRHLLADVRHRIQAIHTEGANKWRVPGAERRHGVLGTRCGATRRGTSHATANTGE